MALICVVGDRQYRGVSQPEDNISRSLFHAQALPALVCMPVINVRETPFKRVLYCACVPQIPPVDHVLYVIIIIL